MSVLFIYLFICLYLFLLFSLICQKSHPAGLDHVNLPAMAMLNILMGLLTLIGARAILLDVLPAVLPSRVHLRKYSHHLSHQKVKLLLLQDGWINWRCSWNLLHKSP